MSEYSLTVIHPRDVNHPNAPYSTMSIFQQHIYIRPQTLGFIVPVSNGGDIKYGVAIVDGHPEET